MTDAPKNLVYEPRYESVMARSDQKVPVFDAMLTRESQLKGSIYESLSRNTAPFLSH